MTFAPSQDLRNMYPATHMPQHVAEIVCQSLGIDKYSRVLEPSAGVGGVVSVIQKFTSNITAVELNENNYYKLTNTAGKHIRGNFLLQSPQELGLVSHVIMCPPKDSDAHISHALNFLKPDGLLYALVQNCNVFQYADRMWPTFERYGLNDVNIPCSYIIYRNDSNGGRWV